LRFDFDDIRAQPGQQEAGVVADFVADFEYGEIGE
jgi:hypothetical protein